MYTPIIAKVRREIMEEHAKKIRPKLKLTTGWSMAPKGLKLIKHFTGYL